MLLKRRNTSVDDRVVGELFECLVEEEHEVLQEAAELSAS